MATGGDNSNDTVPDRSRSSASDDGQSEDDDDDDDNTDTVYNDITVSSNAGDCSYSDTKLKRPGIRQDHLDESHHQHNVDDKVSVPVISKHARPKDNATALNVDSNQALRHNKNNRRTKKHRGRKQKHQRNRLASAKRYFEKQLLIRNRTLSLLGGSVEKILHSSVPDLPGKSPFTDWYRPATPQTTTTTTMTTPTTIVFGTDTTRVPFEEDTVEYDYEMFTSKDFNVQHNFGTTLARLLQALANSSSGTNIDGTPCQQWMDCRNTLQEVFLGSLPACPCQYPSGIFYEDKIWDAMQERYFRWRDASSERLDVYKPGAEYCIRSLFSQESVSVAAQHCCYDKQRKLLTRGSGAGNPNFVSPDVSMLLHDRVDILPWRLCKGDFTKYNRVRPPNNDNKCAANPNDEEFNKQVQLTKNF